MASEHIPLPRYYVMTALTVALVLGLVLCYLIALPFLPAIVWSVTLAVLFSRLERRLQRIVKTPGMAATITVTIAAIVVVVPFALVSGTLINEVVESGNLLRKAFTTETWTRLVHDHPEMAPAIRWINQQIDPQQLVQLFTEQLGKWSADLVQGSISSVVGLLVTFYFLFYLLRDQDRALKAVQRMLPFSTAEFHMLMDRISSTIFASVYGTAVVAALQGTLGGLMFWWLGLPSPLFWGVVMGLLAIVPFLGAFVIWAPAAVILAMQGQIFSAILLTLWGMIVVGLVDNVLYPILVGKQLALHTVPAFIAIIGGLILFGTHGVVLGPVIMAVSMTLLEIWRSRIDVDYTTPSSGS